ncbi:MAG: 3-deoxy-manno-octulosonate cytidylyltransferase [Gammaproteobacteria bacterium]
MTAGAPAFNVVIPARYASTRLPGKPLSDIGGAPMVVRTVEQVIRSGASEIVVATDDQRVLEACTDAGVDAMMTSADHRSGTDRMFEVVEARGWSNDQIVINVQGDEPFIPPDSIVQVAELLQNGKAQIATLATPVSASALTDPNVVKVVRSANDTAIYFSRAAVPMRRDDVNENQVEPLRHIGIYGYRSEALKLFAEAGCCELELHEQLEQLRALWHGWPISVGLARTIPEPGVDTPDDLANARDYFNRLNRSGTEPAGKIDL